jgi:hypothetical protein
MERSAEPVTAGAGTESALPAREEGTLAEHGPVLGPELLRCLDAGDFDGLERLLAPTVWLRAVLVRRVHETSTARGAVDALRAWTATPHGRLLVDAGHHRMAGREFVRYRFLLRPPWAPEEWRVMEQCGYLRVCEGRISRLDLACSGYHPVDPAEMRRMVGGAPTR